MPQTATTRRAGAILDLSSVPLEEQGLMCPGTFKGASRRTKIGSSRGRSPFSNRLFLLSCTSFINYLKARIA